MKSILGRISSKFVGYQQHDSHEAFSLLIEQIHEDMNRISEKVYTEMKDVQGEDLHICAERWRQMSKKRDDSLVTD